MRLSMPTGSGCGARRRGLPPCRFRPRAGESPGSRRALSNPFDIGAEALDEIAGLMDLAADVDRATLWLPSTAEGPVASSPVIEEPPEQPGDVALRAWETTALGLEADDIVKLLTNCPPDRTFAPGLFAAADLAYWTMALRFAGAIVARGAVLPDLVRAADGKRLRQMAARVPGTRRAGAGPAGACHARRGALRRDGRRGAGHGTGGGADGVRRPDGGWADPAGAGCAAETVEGDAGRPLAGSADGR